MTSPPETPPSLRVPGRASAVQIALAYAAAGALFIPAVPLLMRELAPDPGGQARLVLVGAWVFVAISAVVLGWALDRHFRGIRHAADQLQESEERSRALFEHAVDGIILLTQDGRILRANAAFARMHGYDSPRELESLSMADLDTEETAAGVQEHLRRVSQGEILTFEVEHYRKDRSVFPLSATASRVDLGGLACLQVFHRDITEQKRSERLRVLSADVFRILNDSQALPDAARRILDAIRRGTGIEAVGIRLRENHDFPYAAATGFSESFLQAENQLAARGKDSEFCLDEHGNVRLECTCGLVLSGQIDPTNPLFTPGGSAWTNDARPPAAAPPPQDPRLNPRNRCLHDGFRSVALIPIRVDRDIIGLLQLNDRRKDRFTPELIRYFEGLGSSFGVALQRLKEELAVRESGRLLLEAQQLAHLGSWSLDLANDRLEASAEVYRILERQPAAFDGSYAAFLGTMHPDDRERVDRAFAVAVRDRTPCDIEHRLLLPEGRMKFVQERCRPEYDAGGRAVRLLGTVQDITARKEAEEQLRRSEERYHSFIRHSHEAIYRLELHPPVDTRLPVDEQIDAICDRAQGGECNDAMARICGLSTPEAFAGLPWSDLHQGLSRTAERARFRKFIESGYRTVDAEAEETTPWGDRRHFRRNAVGIVENGKLLRIWGTAIDIQERQEEGRALRESEIRFRSLFEHSPDGLLLIDAQTGDVEAANPAALALFGAAQVTELSASSPGQLSPEHQPDGTDSAVAARERIATAVREGFHSFEWTHRRCDGQEFLAQVQLVRVDQGDRTVLQATVRDITERRRAEQALRQNEALLRKMGRVAKVGGWEFDVDSGEGRWTEEVAHIHDLDTAAPTSKGLGLSFYEGESRARIEAAVANAIAEHTPYDLELEIVSARGVRKWVRTMGEPVVENGRVVRLQGAFQDISERKRWENDLISSHRQQERLLLFNEALLAAIPTPVFYKDQAGRYLGCNQRFTELLGVTAAEIRGKTVDELWPTDNAREYHAKDLELLEHPGEQTYEFVLHDKHGVERQVLCVKNVFRDENDQPAGIIGAFLDITDRKRAAEDLALEVTRRRLLFEGSRDGIVVLDEEGKVVEANRRFTEMLGYTASEVRELHVWDWDRDWNPERVRDAIRALGPEGAYVETRHWRKDGSVVDVALSNSVAESGGRRLVLCVCHDITERKQAEARLRESLLFRREAEKIARIGAWKVNPATDFLYWTEGVYEILEAPLDYKPGLREGLQFYDADSIPALQAALQAALSEGTPFAIEVGLTTMTGEHLWTEVRGLGRLEEGGQSFVMGTFQDITERRQAAEALSMREKIFSIIVGQATDAIAVVDCATSRFVEFNTSAHEGLGYTREEFARFSVPDIQAEHSLEVIDATNAAIRRDGHATFETQHRHRDGSLRDVRVSIRSLALRDRDYLAAVWTDITDRKRAAAQATRDKLRTEFLLELHRRAPQMTDKELYDHVLDQAVRLTESVLGFFHQVSEDQRTIILTTWNQQALATCTAAYDTHYPVDRAGNWVDCIREQRPVVFNDYLHSPHQRGLPPGHAPLQRFMSIPVIQEGRVRIIFGVGNRTSDYTDEDVAQLQIVANELHKIMVQRTAERQLRQLSRAVEQSPVSVVITDTQGAIEYVNPRFSQVSGYTPEEVRGQNPRILKSGDMPPEHYRQLWETLLAGRAWHGEFHNRKKNGELHWEYTSISPITDPAGRISHFVAVTEDITERKRLESELRQAQKLEAVGQLAGGVAHDFNNILAAIMMHLGLLQENPALDAETLQSLKELETEAQRAAALTRQLLMFSRRSVLTIRPQDMNEVVANLLKMLTRLIGENIKLRFDGGSLLPSVEADAGMLEQVLMNLVVNARDAMPHGGRITISTSVVDLAAADATARPGRRHGRFVCLAVSDTGTGMDEATLKRIFEPFFTTKEAGRGTGLGLATVHGIVAQHNGWVEVESAVGAGTTFWVFLPAMTRQVAPTTPVAENVPLPRGRETILVVEDEPRVRKVVSQRLRGLGYQVLEAENGQDAMLTWQRCGAQVDLLFTDMVMPEGMTGLELAERLRATKPGLKVILTSGYSAEIVSAGSPTKIGITYLPKPYADTTLAEVVRACLDPRT